MEWQHGPYRISTDKGLLQLARIHRFLSEEAYWCLGVPAALVERAMINSLCFGVYAADGVQIGYARVVSDYATFAWLCDVYIEQDYRGQGLSKKLMECVLAHPDLQGLRRLCLATKDAHTLYEKYGFKPTETPQNWLEIKDNDIYRKNP